MTVSTFGWDTVYAADISYINKIMLQESSNFIERIDYIDDELEAELHTNLTDWQITSGGDGHIVSISCNINNSTFIERFSEDGFIEMKSNKALLKIDIRLEFFSSTNIKSNKNLFNLKIKPTAIDENDSPVIFRSLTLIDDPNFNFSNYLGNDDYEEMQEFIIAVFEGSIRDGIEENINLIEYVFNQINISNSISEDGWEWIKPTSVSYSITENDISNSNTLGILCMTNGRKPNTGGYGVDANIIPNNSQSGFLINEERFLNEVIKPAINWKYPKISIEDIVFQEGLPGDAFKAKLETKPINVNLDTIEYKGNYYYPKLISLSILLQETYVVIKSEVHIDLQYEKAVAVINVEQKLKLKLITDKNGSQKLTYEKHGDPIESHYVENEPSNAGNIILGILAGIMSIFTVFIPVMGELVVVALIAALTLGLMEYLFNIGNILAGELPPLDSLNDIALETSLWSKDKFNLINAQVFGAIQLGGNISE